MLHACCKGFLPASATSKRNVVPDRSATQEYYAVNAALRTLMQYYHCCQHGLCACVQNHQIDQLKEEISGKDLALVKEHFDHMKVCSTVALQIVLWANTMSAYANVPKNCPDRSFCMH